MRHFLSMAVVALAFTACSDDYDDTELWNKVNDHEDRIEALETWQGQMNNNIAALQELINTTDYITTVTPVLENGEEVGYTIAFLHSDPITIYHGEKGDKGDQGEQGEQGEQGPQGEPGEDGSDGSDGSDGDTPVIGVKADGGIYYWTVNGEWLLNDNQEKMPVTGEKGEDGDDAIAPQVRINKETNMWEISTDGGANWTSTEVEATGDSFFQSVDTSKEDYVTFTLEDGTTFQVPRYQSLKIGDGTGTLALIGAETEIKLTLPDGTTAADYSALVAQITPEGADGTYTDIATRSGDVNGWKVEGDLENTKVTVTAGSGTALLRVTLIRNNGDEVTASRIVEKPNYTVSEDGTSYTVYNTEGFLAWAKAVKEQKERAENADPTHPIPKEEDLNCVLAADVDLQGIEWEVLAPNVNYPYGGTLDGAGHTISNLTINVTSGKASFIGNGTGCTIKNLTLVNPNITNMAGGLGAFLQTMNTQAVLENCHVVGGKLSATGNNGTNVGGLVGEVYSGSTIRACSSSAEVSGKNYVGGIAGIVYNNYEDVQIIACYATGTLTAKSTSIGGLVGKVNKSVTNLFTSCYYQVKDVQYGYYFNNTGGSDGTTSVGNDTSAWQTAAENMNAALSGQDYQWMLNEGEDKDDRPLILKKAE